MLVGEAGGSDEDRDAAGYCPVEAGAKRGGRREIDQYVGVILIDREAGIFAYRLGDRLAHPAVRRDEADADRLVGRAHDSAHAERRSAAQSAATLGLSSVTSGTLAPGG